MLLFKDMQIEDPSVAGDTNMIMKYIMIYAMVSYDNI